MRITITDKAILGKAPMLSSAPKSVQETVYDQMIIEESPKKSVLFSEGDPASCFYIVIRGWISIYRVSAEGKRANIGLFGPGESFGEAAMFLSMRYPVNCEVVEDSRYARIEARGMRQVIEADPAAAFALLGSMSKHLKNLVDQLSGDRLLSSRQRVARFLLNLYNRSGSEGVLHLPYDKTVIASSVGLTPEALSRAFASLRDIGVAVDRRTVSIASVDRLRDVAELPG